MHDDTLQEILEEMKDWGGTGSKKARTHERSITAFYLVALRGRVAQPDLACYNTLFLARSFTTADACSKVYSELKVSQALCREALSQCQHVYGD